MNNPTSQAGITCTTCHSITNVNDTRGNAAYTIEEPEHYPFASSDDPFLQWINNALVKAKPEMHKKTFFRPILKDPKFCSTCHKVGLPFGVTHYKDFVRGQNHYDTVSLLGRLRTRGPQLLLSGSGQDELQRVSHGAQALGRLRRQGFRRQGRPRDSRSSLHRANTGLAALLGNKAVADRHARFLSDKKVRIDIFGLREGGRDRRRACWARSAPRSRAEARREVPGRDRGPNTRSRSSLQPGHRRFQRDLGRADRPLGGAGHRPVGRDGPDDSVDPYSHFINVFMLDREGNRIDRRNPQDIFVQLYNKQIPPGAGQVVHFALEVPASCRGPITLEARLNYRKFDRTYMDYIYGKGKGPKLPVVVMARDEVQLAVEGGPPAANEPSPVEPVWQRWNDYGIGLLLEGGTTGGQKGELKQAEQIFLKVAEMGPADGWVNLARVYQKEGRIPEARPRWKRLPATKNRRLPGSSTG